VVADMGISRRKLEATRRTRRARVPRTEAQAADLAAIVAELRAGGSTLQAIAAALNERGIPTATGAGEWRKHQVWRVLTRRRRCPD
jgi:Recombinase